MGLIMARLKGSLVSEVGVSRRYVVRVRGRQARVSALVAPSPRGSRIRVVVERYGPVVVRVSRLLVEELERLRKVTRSGPL